MNWLQTLTALLQYSVINNVALVSYSQLLRREFNSQKSVVSNHKPRFSNHKLNFSLKKPHNISTPSKPELKLSGCRQNNDQN